MYITITLHNTKMEETIKNQRRLTLLRRLFCSAETQVDEEIEGRVGDRQQLVHTHQDDGPLNHKKKRYNSLNNESSWETI